MEMDMSQEREIVARELMPEGERVLRILSAEEKISKAGNGYIEWSVMDIKTNACDIICTITTQGKRWALKNMLDACKVGINDGEIYIFELEELKDKYIVGINKHVEEEFINRKGEPVQSKKNKFTNFMPYVRKEGEEEIPF